MGADGSRPVTPPEEHVDKKARPTQYPAARKSAAPIKTEPDDHGKVPKGCPLAKPPAPMPSMPSPPPQQPARSKVSTVPSPSTIPKGAAPIKREPDDVNAGGTPNKKATPPKVPPPVQAKISSLPPAPSSQPYQDRGS